MKTSELYGAALDRVVAAGGTIVTFATGTMCVFNYPSSFKTLPEYSAHSGQSVRIVRPLTAEEADGPAQGVEQMYRVRAADGWEGDAFESELNP